MSSDGKTFETFLNDRLPAPAGTGVEYERRIHAMIERVGEEVLINTTDPAMLKLALSPEKCSRATLMRDLSILRQYRHFRGGPPTNGSIATGWITKDVVDASRYISPEDLEKIVTSLPQRQSPWNRTRNDALYRVIYDTGFQTDWVCEMTWAQVNLKGSRSVQRKKITYLLAQKTGEALLAYQALYRGEQDLFTVIEGAEPVWITEGGDKLEEGYLNRTLRGIDAKLKRESLSLADFRTSYALNFIKTYPGDYKELSWRMEMTEGNVRKIVRCMRPSAE